MNKKVVIGVVVAVVAVLILFMTTGKEKEEVVVTPEKTELTVVETVKEEKKVEKKEEAPRPKIEEKKITTSAAQVEKVELKPEFTRPLKTEKKEFVYVVRPGDTLWSIALEYYRDPYGFEKLAAHNKISQAEVIYPGMVIKFPETYYERDYVYTVKKGDTLWKITKEADSLKNPMLWSFLAGYNGIDVEKRIVWEGMKLRIPYEIGKYEVKEEGMDLFKIAEKIYDFKYAKLLAARLARYNNIDYVYYVKPGTIIYYPIF
ncbi:MAG: LysM peptidoglycan-binding domain-containing protein [Candidatus Muiribacteriota bacterium]